MKQKIILVSENYATNLDQLSENKTLLNPLALGVNQSIRECCFLFSGFVVENVQ